MTDRDPVWDELSLLQNTWIRIWQSYMRWFSWHFLVHIGALGTVLTNVAMREHAGKVAIFMGLFGALGAGAAACMCAYDYSARKQVESLRRSPVANNALFGAEILKFARWACLVTKILLVGTWVIVGFSTLPMPT
jgi:hypothetical protein